MVVDSNVLRKAIDGDSVARRNLLGQYRPLVRLVAARYARRTLGRRFDESDVVQLTCMQAFNGFASFRGATQAEFSAWLQTILERNLIKLWRHHSAQQRDFRQETYLFGHDESTSLSIAWRSNSAEDPTQKLLSDEVAMILAEAIDQLPTDYRVPIELRFIDGLKIRDVAEQLETTVGAIAGKLRRGLKTLESLLPAEMRNVLEG